MKGVSWRLWFAVGALLAGLGVGAYVIWGSPVDLLDLLRGVKVETLRESIQGFGVWAPLASAGLMLVHTFVPFPLEVLALANGLVFGAWAGIAVTWVSMVLSAWLGYAAARFARPLVFRLGPGERLGRVQKWAERRSSWELVAIRFVPIVSFSLLNLALGLLKVPFWRFTWTTALGIVPVVVVSVLFGHLLTIGPWGWLILSAAAVVGFGAWYLMRKYDATKSGG